MWPFKTGDILKEVKFIFYDRTRKRRSLNTGDYLNEVTALPGFTLCKY